MNYARVDTCEIMQAIEEAFERMRSAGIPAGVLEPLRLPLCDAAVTARSGRVDRTNCYLAFYGIGDRASFLKIGVAKNVARRISALSTANPMPCLWAYSASLITRPMAMAVESMLLQHLASDKAQGEWINLHGISEQVAEEIVKSLAEVASHGAREPVNFTRQAF